MLQFLHGVNTPHYILNNVDRYIQFSLALCTITVDSTPLVLIIYAFSIWCNFSPILNEYQLTVNNFVRI
jgi:hypothetical protein